MLPAGSIVGALYHKLQTQSSAPEDGLNYRPKHLELIDIISKLLLFYLVCCLYHHVTLYAWLLDQSTRTFMLQSLVPCW